MKKVLVVFVPCLIIWFVSYIYHQKIEKESKKQIDSLNSEVIELNHKLETLEKDNSKVEVEIYNTSVGEIINYSPNNLKIRLHSERPSFDESTFLCVPAAFTSPKTTIEGVFIEKGSIINKNINNSINGFVMFNKEEFIFESIQFLSKDLISKATRKKYNLFQELLLVKNSTLKIL